jgi:hypothetical protein
VLGLFLAFETRHRCTDTQGTFPLDSAAALPSHLCRVSHLYPGSFGRTLALFALYLVPAAIAAVATVVGLRRKGRGLYWAGLLLAAALVSVEVMWMSEAHLAYHGV